MRRNNEGRPKTRDQINKRGPSVKQCKGKKVVKQSKRKRGNSSSTYTDEPRQKSDSGNMKEDTMIFVPFAVAVSVQKKVRNVTGYDASTVANGCKKTVATVIVLRQVLTLFVKANIHGQDRLI
jgi:hypothetical protein